VSTHFLAECFYFLILGIGEPVGLFINMWQWVWMVFSKHLNGEMETNFVFFTCVWLIPMMLILSMDCSWELLGYREPEMSSANTHSEYEPKVLSFFRSYLGTARNRDTTNNGGVRRRSLSLQMR
jgi:hypothetical protein